MDNNALFKLGYGLYVLTARDGKDNGCIVNTVMQITAVPNRLAIAVNKDNLTHGMIQKTKKCNISILTTEAPFSLYQHFGFQSGKNVDKFAGYQGAKRADNGIYYLTEGTNAWLSASVEKLVDCGSHTLFIAALTDAALVGQGDSVTYDYYHKSIKPRPEKAEKTEKTGYRCKICGYIYEGEELPEDFICPICKHGAADFEKI